MLAINDLVGIPFENKGRSLEGCDCWGLLRLYYQELLSITLPSYDQYDNTQDGEKIASLINHYKDAWQPVTEPQLSDVVLMRVDGQDMHVGVYVGDSKFLHIRDGGFSTIEKLRSPKWQNRIAGYYRYV